jgi:glutaredoxin
MRTATLLLSAALLLLSLTGCGDGVDHYASAVAIERELLRETPEATYEHHRYVLVLRELNRVPLRDGKRDEADGMARRIMDGRRIALNQAMPQVDHLPDRLRGKEAPMPPRPYSAAAPPPAAAPVATAQRPVDAEGLSITLYSTSWCGYCRKARNWFTSQGIPFVEKDIESDPDGAAEYRAKANGYGGVPLIDVNGTAVRGFDQRRIEALIVQAGG